MSLISKKMSNDEFAAKWEHSKTKLYRFAYCYVKNEHDAMEILSEATYKAYCSLNQLKHPHQFDTWMGRIIINTSMDFIKKQKRFTGAEIEELEVGEPYPYDQLEDKIDVYQALESLALKERAVVILKYFEEKSFKEIGELMDLPEATVKTKLYRSLEKMREYWEKEEASYGKG